MNTKDTQIISKTARDGREMTISLDEAGHGTLTSWVLTIRHGGREIAQVQARPRPFDEPVGDATHGIVIGPHNKSVGLTADEARTIEATIDAHKAKIRARINPAQTAAAVAAMHCKACGGRLSSFDLGAAAIEGYHFNCV